MSRGDFRDLTRGGSPLGQVCDANFYFPICSERAITLQILNDQLYIKPIA